MHHLRDIIRGMGSMPHVGSHPGTGFVLGMAAIMILATGAGNGAAGAALGLIAWASTILPIYAIGAHSRARLSDRLERHRLARETIQAWVRTWASGPVREALCMSRQTRPKSFRAWMQRTDAPAIPETVRAILERIMTRSLDGRRPYTPHKGEMRTITVEIDGGSSHAVLAGHARLREIQEMLA